MKVLVTGAAGFIGYHTIKRLVQEGYYAVGIDNINDYYDINLKFDRLSNLGVEKNKIKYNFPVLSSEFKNLTFFKMDLIDRDNLFHLFKRYGFDVVINLAAQAGVRYSLTNPYVYIDSNINGFLNILEACRQYKIKHLVYASSSSVYGLNKSIPFSVHDNVDHPVSLYAATKKSNELMAHTYSHLYNLPTTGLRFFTVYGPWGRPDMALFLFTKAIIEGKSIDIYNNGNMERDFTYIDDVVEGIFKILSKPPKGNNNWTGEQPDPGSSIAPYKLYNIGSNNPVKLLDFVSIIEKFIDKKAKKRFMPLQPGDVVSTYADLSDLINDVNYRPTTPIQIGIEKFINWYREYYGK